MGDKMWFFWQKRLKALKIRTWLERYFNLDHLTQIEGNLIFSSPKIMAVMGERERVVHLFRLSERKTKKREKEEKYIKWELRKDQGILR